MPSNMMIPQHFHLSHRSIKTRFAYRFLRALKKLNDKSRTAAANPGTTASTTSSSSCVRETTRRYHMVKTAAYASMAAAVGSKRAWSRALLWKIRNRSLLKRNKAGARASLLSKKTSTGIKENPSNACQELQKLVPGGEVMDFCSLLDETAHYIKCLTSQVQIMRNIVDFYSA